MGTIGTHKPMSAETIGNLEQLTFPIDTIPRLIAAIRALEAENADLRARGDALAARLEQLSEENERLRAAIGALREPRRAPRPEEEGA